MTLEITPISIVKICHQLGIVILVTVHHHMNQLKVDAAMNTVNNHLRILLIHEKV